MTNAVELAAGGAAAAAVRRGRALVGLGPTLSRAGRSRGAFDASDRGTWRASNSPVARAVPDRVGSLRSISRLPLAKRRINLRLRFIAVIEPKLKVGSPAARQERAGLCFCHKGIWPGVSVP